MAVCLTPWLMDAGSLGRSTVRPNKGMKQTKPEHNGASQLIPGVGRTCCGATKRTRRPGVATSQLPLPEQWRLQRLGASVTSWRGRRFQRIPALGGLGRGSPRSSARRELSASPLRWHC